MKGSDLAIALAGGAASGFLEDAARENKDAKLMQEKEREAQLLALKDQRIAAREMAKQKDTQAFDLLKMGKEQEFKTQESQRKTASEFMSKDAERDDKMEELRVKHGYDKELEGIKSAGKKGKGGLTEFQEMRLEESLAKLEDEGVSETNLNRINTIRRNLGMPTYTKVVTDPGADGNMFGYGKKAPVEEYVLDGEGKTTAPPGGTTPQKTGDSKFSSIFKKVAGTRTKTRANDDGRDINQPYPLPGTYGEELPGNFNQ